MNVGSHPLNRAALVVLKQAGSPPWSLPPEMMPVLLLAISELAAANELDDRLAVLSQWASSPQKQAQALAKLARVLEPDELLQGTPMKVAEQIANELQPL